MKTLTVLVLAVIAGTSGYLIKVPVAPILQPRLAPSGWIHLQKLMLPLFENVCEPSTDPVISRLSQEFASNMSTEDFWDPEVLTKVQTLKTGKGFLPKGQIFSEYNVEHTNELKIMFNVMSNAKSFDTFYKVAAWSRQNLNCGLYVNLIYMSLENRKDTEKLTLPPPYELLPNYFIKKDIIIQGSSLLAGEEFTPSEGVRDEGNAYTLDANYTANFYDNDDESKLAYFREDIGLNSYYFLNMLKWAPKLSETININSRYGEEIYHMMKQLVARYNLERYANGLPEQDDLSWDSLSDAPYDPMLVYSNGNEFIHRTSPVQLPENEDKALLQTIENNISTVVGHMRDAGYNKTQILNHLMEILVTGERSYDILARHLLGKALSNNGEPTVFDHYMTSLRDPMIWRMYKKMVYIVDNALQMLPSYTKSELYFPGVEVVSIDVKKMMTNFDYFEFDITEALKIGNGDTKFRVKIGQSRLNHKPFAMKLNISSLVTQKGLVKIYLGPKVMPGEFTKNKNLFHLLDSVEINLKKGTNIVSRTSSDMKMYAPDFTSLKTLSKKVEDAQFGLDSLPLNNIDSQIGFPERLMIPKGTPEGLFLQLFVFVAPFMKVTAGKGYLTPNLEFNPAILSPLYPLDLTIEDKVLLDLPNTLLKDLMVTHKGVSKVNSYGGSGASKSWSSRSESIPNMDSNENEPFDYKTKQFGYETYQTNDFTRSNANYYYDGEQNDDSMTQTKPLKLKAGGFDYSSRQSYDYKSKRPQYKKPDYASKRVDYKAIYQNKSTEEPKDLETQNKQQNKDLVNERTFMGNLPVEYDTNKHFNPNNDEYDDNLQNDDSSVGVHHYLLRSSTADNISYEKDTKFKRPKIVRPDYKKMYKNLWKMTESPVNKSKSSKQNKVDEDLSETRPGYKFEVIPKEETINIFRLIEDDDKSNSDRVEPSKKENYLVVEDVGKMDMTHVVGDKTDTSMSDLVSPSNKNDKLFFRDISNADNNQYFGMYKDDSGEELVKLLPVTKPSMSDSNDNMYKYIMRVIHNDNVDENVLDN